MKSLIVIIAAILYPTITMAAESIRPGLWEMATSMEMPGLPMQIPPTKMQHCYSKEDVKDQKNVINRDKNCKMTDYKVSGNKVTWKMVCTGENPGTFSGETTFFKDEYVSKMKMNAGGKSMDMKMNAKRLGECP